MATLLATVVARGGKVLAASLWGALVLSPTGTLALSACSANAAKTPNATRPVDEGRAVEVIRQAMLAEGAEPTPGRDVVLLNGTALHVDVGVLNREYGISYISAAEARQLGTGIPPPNKKDERLRLARAGEDGEVRIVLLYQENYLYDDLVGEGHERTAIASERALARDVQDFITHARTQKYK